MTVSVIENGGSKDICAIASMREIINFRFRRGCPVGRYYNLYNNNSLMNKGAFSVKQNDTGLIVLL